MHGSMMHSTRTLVLPDNRREKVRSCTHRFLEVECSHCFVVKSFGNHAASGELEDPDFAHKLGLALAKVSPAIALSDIATVQDLLGTYLDPSFKSL